MTVSKETKREKFVRLAETRTNTVLDKIRILGNCANPYAYEYADSDVREIFSAIENELKIARAQFRTSDAGGKFELTESASGRRAEDIRPNLEATG